MKLKFVKNIKILLFIFSFLLYSGKKKKKLEDEKIEMKFKRVLKDIANIEHKEYVDQIGPAIIDTLLKHAQPYKDKDGKMQWKKKFSRNELEDLNQEIIDQLGYHAHRRAFKIKPKQYETLKKFKDEKGRPYIENVVRYHFGITKEDLDKHLILGEKENKVTYQKIETVLEPAIKRHTSLLTRGMLDKSGLEKAEHRDVIVKTIDEIVKRFNLSPNEFNTGNVYQSDELTNMYLKLAEFYKDGDDKKTKKHK